MRVCLILAQPITCMLVLKVWLGDGLLLFLCSSLPGPCLQPPLPPQIYGYGAKTIHEIEIHDLGRPHLLLYSLLLEGVLCLKGYLVQVCFKDTELQGLGIAHW